MSIATVFAHVSCRDLTTSLAWYEKLFGTPPIRRPMPRLAEWQFTESAEVQLYEEKEHAGLKPGPIEEADDFFIMRLRDPDGNLVVFASAVRT